MAGLPDSLGDLTFYLGEFSNTVDAQRRVTIPSCWRRGIPEENQFFVLPGRQTCLQIVPAEAFVELLQQLRRVSIADRQAGVALATIGSMAQHVVCDRQGRIGFSPQLLSYAGLGVKEKVVLVGAVTTIQVWSPALWDEQRMDSDKCLDVIQALQEKPEDSGRVLQALIGRNA